MDIADGENQKTQSSGVNTIENQKIRRSSASRKKGGGNNRPRSASSLSSSSRKNGTATGRPRSAKAVATTATGGAKGKSKPSARGSRPPSEGNMNSRRQDAARRGTRMRRDSKSSASAPELRFTATAALRDGTTPTANTAKGPRNERQMNLFGRREGSAGSSSFKAEAGGDTSADVVRDDRLREVESRNEELLSRCRHLEKNCARIEVEGSARKAELASYKAEVRSRVIAVGKAEVILNEVCMVMVERLGRADGANVSATKGRALLEVHEAPAQFAALVKKNAFLQMSKWEIDRATLEALAQRAGKEAEAAAQVHEAERADLVDRTERLETRIRGMQELLETRKEAAHTMAQESVEKVTTISSARDALVRELETAALRNEQLTQELVDRENGYQAQLDRFMEYPKAAENMAEKLDKCEKSARRGRNLVNLERREFRRQLQIFQKWQSENKDLRRQLKLAYAQVLTLRGQLTVAERGSAGTSSTRKAVVRGTVDRLQRAEISAKHKANKYCELAGTRGVRLAQLETEVSQLKATVQKLRRMCDAPKHDTYEMEIARLARVSPEVLDVQKKAGLSEEDMKASLAELKVLRAREEQKDALVAIVRERDGYELEVKDLRARNAWLEKKPSASTDAFRSIAGERPPAGVSGSDGAAKIWDVGGGGESGPVTRESNGNDRAWATACDRGDNIDPVLRLEKRLDFNMRRRETGGGPLDAGPQHYGESLAEETRTTAAPELTGSVLRKIQFLRDCDWTLEKQRQREQQDASARASSKRRVTGGHESSGGTVHAARAIRQRPHSAHAQGSRGRGVHRNSISCGLFRGGGGGTRIHRQANVSQDDSGVAHAI